MRELSVFADESRDVQQLARRHYDYLLEFDTVKIYYDNGQSVVTKSLHEAFESCLSSNVPVFKEDMRYRSLRLCQAADMICGFEFLAMKFAKGGPVQPSNSDKRFFDNRRDLRNRYLKKLAPMRLE